MEGAGRKRLVALVVLLAVGGVFVAIALAGQGDPPATGAARHAGLRVEALDGDPPQLTISLEDPALNRLATTRGKHSVTVECVDRNGTVAVRTKQQWPFAGTDQTTAAPHVHLTVESWQLRVIARCRLAGTRPALEGRVS